MSNNNLTRDRDILGYIPARLTPNKRWYVEWYSFNPDEGRLQRKRISVPHIKPLALRRRYAADMVANVNAQLASGWNPLFRLLESSRTSAHVILNFSTRHPELQHVISNFSTRHPELQHTSS